MTIQDAIKSLKPFKRKNWTHAAWLCVRHLGGYGGGELWWVGDENDPATIYYTDDLLADDWETQDQARVVQSPVDGEKK